jgi:hypothetical protein
MVDRTREDLTGYSKVVQSPLLARPCAPALTICGSSLQANVLVFVDVDATRVRLHPRAAR